MVNVKYGLESGWKARAAGDRQIQQALGLFDEAARVAALPKKANPGAGVEELHFFARAREEGHPESLDEGPG